MANELKPCPFCNSNRVTVHKIRDGQQAICKDCCATGAPIFHGKRGPEVTHLEAVEAWNTRPAAPVEGLRNVGHIDQEYVVTRSQAEDIIAAERQRAEEAERDANEQSNVIFSLQADNAALTARVEAQVEHIATLDSNLEAMEKRAQEGETQLSATRKALGPFADHAKERVVDEPEWRDNYTLQIVVTIGELRQARAALEANNGE